MMSKKKKNEKSKKKFLYARKNKIKKIKKKLKGVFRL